MKGAYMNNVDHPSHYTFGEIEVIDYIKDKLTTDQLIGYFIGNVLKYTSRWEHKGGVEDLKKAQVYLGWAIEKLDEPKPVYTDDHVGKLTRLAIELEPSIADDNTCELCGVRTKTYARADGKHVCARCYNKEEVDNYDR